MNGQMGGRTGGRTGGPAERKKIVFHLQIIDVGGVDLFDREKKEGGVKRERETERERTD